MREFVLVGLIDSGIAAPQRHRVAGEAGFALDTSGGVIRVPATEDRVAHGSALAALILDAAPGARLLSAQVFRGGPSTPAAIAAGLQWCVAAGARIVNMSFGLREDREVLRAACREAIAADVLLVASAPARGSPVFPAAYPGVVSVCGDARCAPGRFSALGDGADFGACPQPLIPGPAPSGGASFATARVSGALAALGGACRDEMLARFQAGCAYRQRERVAAGSHECRN